MGITEEEELDIIETNLYLMNDYINDNPCAISEPNIYDILLEEILDFFIIQFENFILSDDDMTDINNLLEETANIFFSTIAEKSIKNVNLEKYNKKTDEEINNIEKQITYLQNFPQPAQRTPEWYQYRRNLITASNAYKAFEKQSSINQLIYEKCQPIIEDDKNDKIINTNSSLHWGQKYEPLSVLLYEQKKNVKVSDFGCIQHQVYSFLGASPDGIITDKNSDIYGRMLEIKNVVSREINGVPKKEYWIQMQLQMEVCNLEECDFLETKFTEYLDSESFYKDTKDDNVTISSDNMTKGIIIYFNTPKNTPFYVYKPLELINEKDILEWEENNLNIYQSEEYNYTFLKFIYWKLEVYSCILVYRNKEWFKNNIEQLEKVWKIIEHERIHGYDHRCPNKKEKKDKKEENINTSINKCLLPFNKIIKLE
jgi:putative phage-type endonuclease